MFPSGLLTLLVNNPATCPDNVGFRASLLSVPAFRLSVVKLLRASGENWLNAALGNAVCAAANCAYL